jgi:hypothetical protein
MLRLLDKILWNEDAPGALYRDFAVLALVAIAGGWIAFIVICR